MLFKEQIQSAYWDLKNDMFFHTLRVLVSGTVTLELMECIYVTVLTRWRLHVGLSRTPCHYRMFDRYLT